MKRILFAALLLGSASPTLSAEGTQWWQVEQVVEPLGQCKPATSPATLYEAASILKAGPKLVDKGEEVDIVVSSWRLTARFFRSEAACRAVEPEYKATRAAAAAANEAAAHTLDKYR